MANIHYHIQLNNPRNHYFDISIEIEPDQSDAIVLRMPNWIPGSYMIRDFAKHVVGLTAQDSLGQIHVMPTGKAEYRIEHRDKPIRIQYRYYAFDLSVRKAYLDHEFGFINPAAALFEVTNAGHSECLVTLHSPSDQEFSHWRPASALESTNNDGYFAWQTYRADSYAQLIECPILFGELDIAQFDVANVPHYLVTVGRHFGDLQRVSRDLKQLCDYQANVFGGLPTDLNKYMFLTMVSADGFGGLEHDDCTALLCARYDIANSDQSVDEAYARFLSLCSHEYFHTWNVKRLKPKEFIPYDLGAEQYTEQLWFYEGMTSYFDDLSLKHCGFYSDDQYLTQLAKTLTRVEKGLGQVNQALSESSYHSWHKFYQQDEGAVDQITSYYQKGAIVACLIDLVLITNSGGQRRLADVMKSLWQSFGVTRQGTTPEDLEHALLAYLGSEYTEWLHNLLHNRTKLDSKAIFDAVGIAQTSSAQTKWQDSHGNDIKPASVQTAFIGAQYALKGEQVIVQQVLANSPAEQAGLAVGDQLLAIDHIRVSKDNIDRLVGQSSEYEKPVHFFRKDQLYVGVLKGAEESSKLVGLTIKDQNLAKLWLNPTLS